MILVLLCVGLFVALIVSWYWMVTYHPSHMGPVPEELSTVPPELGDPQHTYYSARVWGGPDVDGPDRNLPDTCFWYGGILHCRNSLK